MSNRQKNNNKKKPPEQNVETLKKRADACYQRKQYKQAIRHYEEALKLNPEVKQIWLNKGLCYKELNRSGKAITAFRKAIELDPLYAKAVYNLASMLPNEQQKALEVIEAYKTAGGDDRNVLALGEKIRSETERHVLPNNSSPDSTVAMLKVMQNRKEKYVQNAASAIQDASNTEQSALPNVNSNTDSEELTIPRRGFDTFVVVPRQHEFPASVQEINLNEVVMPSTALKASECYWIISYLGFMKGEYIARDLVGCNLVLMPELPEKPTPSKREMYLAAQDDKLEYAVWTPKNVIVKGMLECKAITRLNRVTLDSLRLDSWESNMLRFEILEATAKNGHTFRSLYQTRPKEGFSCFHTEDEAVEALTELCMHSVPKDVCHLARAFVFKMNLTIAEFEDLSMRVQCGAKVPDDLINGWKGYQYDDNSNSLILKEEELREDQEKQPTNKPF